MSATRLVPHWHGGPGRQVLAVTLLALGLLLGLPPVLVSLSSGGLAAPALVAAVVFAVVSFRTLMPATLLLVVLAAEALGVFGPRGGDTLPYVQVMAGMRVTVRDALLLGALPLALVRLAQRREAPVFWKPFLGVLAAIAVAFLLGVVADRDVKAPLNALRPLFSYALYPIVVAAVDSRRKLDWFIGAIVGVALVAVVIQAVEASRGVPLPFLALPLAAGQALAGLSVNGRQVPYLWNRATWHLFLALFLGLGCVLEGRAVRTHALVALVCAVGFVIMLTRSWYVFIAVGTAAMLLVYPGWRRRIRFVGLLAAGIAVLVAVAGLASGLTQKSYGGSLLTVWLARTGTLQSFQRDYSYQARVAELAQQWDAVVSSPVLGYGMSAEARHLTLEVGRLDTGAVNTLLVFGVVGTAAFVVLIVYAAWRSFRLVRRLPHSRARGYALGLLGIWTGILVGYAFNWDFLTHPNGPWLVVLALAVQDRVDRLTRARPLAPAWTTADDSLPSRRLLRDTDGACFTGPV